MPPQDTLISQSFTRFLRKVAKLKCPVCGEEFPDTEERIKSHLQEKHQDLLSTTDLSVLVQRLKRRNWDPDPRELKASAGETAEEFQPSKITVPSRCKPRVSKAAGWQWQAMVSRRWHFTPITYTAERSE
ncbi:hypothetical protein SLS62_008021 [Diatrype stigma]|uniref:Uncharacterized protein n=1 Tax=Diatrype stigma TaxID=117547 RepID=A0AAN9UVM7_9PEZI